MQFWDDLATVTETSWVDLGTQGGHQPTHIQLPAHGPCIDAKAKGALVGLALVSLWDHRSYLESAAQTLNSAVPPCVGERVRV